MKDLFEYTPLHETIHKHFASSKTYLFIKRIMNPSPSNTNDPVAALRRKSTDDDDSTSNVDDVLGSSQQQQPPRSTSRRGPFSSSMSWVDDDIALQADSRELVKVAKTTTPQKATRAGKRRVGTELPKMTTE